MNITASPIIQFYLPEHLTCPEPTEQRGIERDAVRLMVTTNAGHIEHTNFNQLPSFLKKGDVLVVNTSATIAAALPVLFPGGNAGMLHVSTKMGDQVWLTEIREIRGNKTNRWHNGEEGMIFKLPAGETVALKKRFYKNHQWLNLWISEFSTGDTMEKYLNENGRPVKYDKLDQQYPLSYYQTFFSFHPGSAEMPSAGRGFTKNLVEKLLKKGVILAPVTLHTGVSSLEENEDPYPEYMEIDPVTASIINSARREGNRVIAVGTTAIRAVETAVNDKGEVISYRGSTDLFIDENYKMKVVDGLLTGFHEPGASHLNMLQSIGGHVNMDRAYKEAIKHGYYWHQFGDLHLIIP